MPVYKTKGLILRSRDFGETDRILTILTQKKGKISSLAKGIRRPGAKFSGNLELFCYVDLVIAEGRNLEIVTSAEAILSFRYLRENLKKTALGIYLLELVDKLTVEKQKNQDLIEIILRTFQKIEAGGDLELVKYYFILNFLSLIGFQPHLDFCLKCHQKKSLKWLFSYQEGGLLDAKCAKIDPTAFPISVKTIKVLRLFLENEIEIIDKLPKEINKQEIHKVSSSFLKYLLGKNLNSERFLEHLEAKNVKLG